MSPRISPMVLTGVALLLAVAYFWVSWTDRPTMAEPEPPRDIGLTIEQCYQLFGAPDEDSLEAGDVLARHVVYRSAVVRVSWYAVPTMVMDAPPPKWRGRRFTNLDGKHLDDREAIGRLAPLGKLARLAQDRPSTYEENEARIVREAAAARASYEARVKRGRFAKGK